MADNMSYSSHQYLPPHPQYYPSSTVGNNNPVHIIPPTRPDLAQRKRPKYTRSKTGCLTCRVKKIKCDETKPQCMRCTHGSRECSWPEGLPTRKKSVARRGDDLDGRPSTAGSSGLSEASTPPARDLTPPRLNLVPVPSRAPSESFVPMHPISSEHDTGRRQLDRSYPHSHNSSLPMIPEPPYNNHAASRYEPSYLHGGNTQSSRLSQIPSYRNMSHQSWNHPPESMDPYYHGHNHHHHSVLHERPLVSHTSPSNDHSHARY